MGVVHRFLLLAGLLCAWQPLSGATFSIATYNVENYLAVPEARRPAKSPTARAKVREGIRALKPDVLALQEIGGTNALLELRSSLKAEGLEYPHWELVAGFDTNIHVAVLSRFPFEARRPHTNEGFLLNGRRFRSSRGFAELDVRVNSNYVFTLLTAHLKSRREVPEADEAEMREQEARLLRRIVDARLRANPDINLVVLGDFNDLRDSQPVRLIVDRGRRGLVDTRPAERNGANQPDPNPHISPHPVTWTYHFDRDDTYSRVDYILLSRGMAREWDTNGTYVLSLPDWGLASDHRPIVARFFAEER